MWFPKTNRLGWHIGGGATILMLLIPIFWPILLFAAAGTVIAYAGVLAVAIAGNVILLTWWATRLAARGCVLLALWVGDGLGRRQHRGA